MSESKNIESRNREQTLNDKIVPMVVKKTPNAEKRSNIENLTYVKCKKFAKIKEKRKNREEKLNIASPRIEQVSHGTTTRSSDSKSIKETESEKISGESSQSSSDKIIPMVVKKTPNAEKRSNIKNLTYVKGKKFAKNKEKRKNREEKLNIGSPRIEQVSHRTTTRSSYSESIEETESEKISGKSEQSSSGNTSFAHEGAQTENQSQVKNKNPSKKTKKRKYRETKKNIERQIKEYKEELRTLSICDLSLKKSRQMTNRPL